METLDDMLEQMEKDTAMPEKVRERYMKTLENLPEKKKLKKLSAPVKAATILLCILALAGGGVYAAGRVQNIQWFLHRTGNQIPVGAGQLVDKEVQVLKTVQSGTELVDVTVEETLCDAHSMLALVRVSAKEKEKYLLVPEGTMPDAYMYTILPESDSQLTVEAYAREHQLQIVAVDVWFADDGDWKITETDTAEVDTGAESTAIENTATNELVCMLEASKKTETKEADVTVNVTAQPYMSEKNTQRANVTVKGENLQTTVAVQDISSEQTETYIPERTNEMKIAGLDVDGVNVYRTEFRTYLVIDFTIENKSMLVEFTRMDGKKEEKTFVNRTGGGADDSNGHRKVLLIYDTGEIANAQFTLTYIVRDPMEDVDIRTGEIVFIKES